MLNVIHIVNNIIHIFYIFLIQQILEHEYNSGTVLVTYETMMSKIETILVLVRLKVRR